MVTCVTWSEQWSLWRIGTFGEFLAGRCLIPKAPRNRISRALKAGGRGGRKTRWRAGRFTRDEHDLGGMPHPSRTLAGCTWIAINWRTRREAFWG